MAHALPKMTTSAYSYGTLGRIRQSQRREGFDLELESRLVEADMTMGDLIGVVIAAGLFVYLLVALFYPEKF